jgi:tRNA A-37 threonylcarbamoyl transferase component Bud32/predicted nucleotidyltransferase
MEINTNSLSKEESVAIANYIGRLANHHEVTGACLYGSKVAGYGNQDSDVDVIIVVKDYPHIVKYSYVRAEGAKVSALIVDYTALQKDAQSGLLGEFVVGRLLHTYEAMINHELFNSIEVFYKKRVILEELFDIVKTTNILCSEISFPLEFILFSKIKRRSSVYPAATYSYYKIYTGASASHNLAFALHGYKKALGEIVTNDKELVILKHPTPNTEGPLLQIGKKRLVISKQGGKNEISLKLGKKLQILSSYFIHVYAGRRIFHYAMKEADSKIKRHRTQHLCLPEFMANPREHYWKLREGLVTSRSNKKWLDLVAKSSGFTAYTVSNKSRLGDMNSRTISYTLADAHNSSRSISIVAKKFAKLKGVKWAALNAWSASTASTFKHSFKVDPLFRLGTEYKALMFLRDELGLNTPTIFVVDLERRILVTSHVEGKNMSHIIQNSLEKESTAGGENIFWIRSIGKQIAMIHSTHFALGNVKPNNIIINNSNGTNSGIFFTDLEQFAFSDDQHGSDPIWDIIQILCWSLKRTKNILIAREIIREFFTGYFSCGQLSTSNIRATTMKEYIIQQLSTKSTDYIKQFYPLISTAIAQSISEVINDFVD